MSPALALSIDGAVPQEFRDIDLRDRPDHPDNKFHLTVLPGETVATVGDEESAAWTSYSVRRSPTWNTMTCSSLGGDWATFRSAMVCCKT
jgi:hypothetical protein